MKQLITEVLCVGLGSCLGGIARFLTGRAVACHWGGIPWATLVVNLLGCAAIGTIGALTQRAGVMSPHLRLLLTVGLCGGFTTFSTFINENVGLAASGQAWAMAAYVGLSVAGGLLVCWGAYRLIA